MLPWSVHSVFYIIPNLILSAYNTSVFLLSLSIHRLDSYFKEKPSILEETSGSSSPLFISLLRLGIYVPTSLALLDRYSTLLYGVGLSCLLHFILFPLWELHHQLFPLPQAVINGSPSFTYTRAVISPSWDFAWAIPFTCHAVPGNIYKSCLSPLDLCTSIIWSYYVKGQKLHTFPFGSKKKEKCENKV